MKALVRGDEVIPEEEWTTWIKEHIDWMCKDRPLGDGWKLITDYSASVTEQNETI